MVRFRSAHLDTGRLYTPLTGFTQLSTNRTKVTHPVENVAIYKMDIFLPRENAP